MRRDDCQYSYVNYDDECDQSFFRNPVSCYGGRSRLAQAGISYSVNLEKAYRLASRLSYNGRGAAGSRETQAYGWRR
jgi:hypothetical protein